MPFLMIGQPNKPTIRQVKFRIPSLPRFGSLLFFRSLQPHRQLPPSVCQLVSTKVH